MKHIFLLATLSCLMTVGACSSDNQETTGATSTEPAECVVGSPGCACTVNYPCETEGYSCVDNRCVECPTGSEGCHCEAGGQCPGSLECINPNPDCTFGCEPATCEQPSVTEPTCGPAELCARTIDECEQSLTEQQCAGWFANASNCLDMDAYTECNCDCVDKPTCSDYFACGNICFNKHCE